MSDPHDVPLGALPVEDFYSYFEARLAQIAGSPSSPGPKSPQQYVSPPSTSVPKLWYSDGYSSSRDSSLPPSSWTPDTPPSDFHPVQGSATPQQSVLPTLFAPLLDDDYSFLRNIDPLLLEADILNVMAMPPVPESARHVFYPSRKRPYTEEGPYNASNDAFSSHKRRKLSTGGHQILSNVVPPPTNDYNDVTNVILNTVNDSYVSALPASNYCTSATFSQAPYPSPHIVHNIPIPSVPLLPALSMTIPPDYVTATQPAPNVSYGTPMNYTPWKDNVDTTFYPPFINDAPPVPLTIPPVYLPKAQPGSSAYPGTGSGTDYSLTFNDNGNTGLYTDFENSNVLPWDPSYLTLPNVANRPLDWNTGHPGPEVFYDTICYPAENYATSVSNVVPPSLDQQASSNGIVFKDHTNIVHTNAVANNATHPGVDFCQHQVTTHEISTTEHVANVTMPNAEVPSTSVAPSVESDVEITIEYIEPESPSHSPSTSSPTSGPNKKRPKKHPSKALWFRDGKKFVCRYKGPACTGGCKLPSDSRRNLLRHMRVHARREIKMRHLAPHQRIALNGIPRHLWREIVKCPLDDAHLHECAFYREHGRRWAVQTMEREDNMRRKHVLWNHD